MIKIKSRKIIFSSLLALAVGFSSPQIAFAQSSPDAAQPTVPVIAEPVTVKKEPANAKATNSSPIIDEEAAINLLSATPATRPAAKVNPNEGAQAEADSKLKREVSGCARLTVRSLRLRCYDDIAISLGSEIAGNTTTERERIETIGFWQVVVERDALGLETIYLSLAPYNQLNTPTAIVRTPILNIRCRDSVTDVYIDWKSQLNKTKVRHNTLDVTHQSESDTLTLPWSLSLDNRAVFHPNATEFVRELRKSKRLLIRLTPISERTETLAFETDKLDEALKILVDRCYNKK